MKTGDFKLILLASLLIMSSKVYSQDMLILPMPGQKVTPTKPASQPTTNPKPNKNVNTTEIPDNRNNYQPQTSSPKQPNINNNSNNSITSNGTILPMPKANTEANTGKNSPTSTQPNNRGQQPNKQKQNSANNNQSGQNSLPSNSNPAIQQPISNTQPLIAIPASTKPSTIQDDDFIPPPPPPMPTKSSQATAVQPPKPAANSNANPTSTAANNEEDLSSFFNDTDFPMPPDEVSASPDGENVENLLPPTQQETTVSSNTTGESITVYPKDTGSAIFMVMKSWKCDDYDAEKLIQQALEVYGKESDDVFQINGLNNLQKGFAVSVEEEDITLDELLDILAAKSGNDWGADIPNKTIYVYPKGIKTESYVSWE